jgi:hypothetical protein
VIETLAIITAAGAALGSVIYITSKLVAVARHLWHLFHLLDAGMELVQRELGESGDGQPSMKDDMAHMAIAIGLLQRHQVALLARINRIAHLGAKHHPEDVWIYHREDDTPP